MALRVRTINEETGKAETLLAIFIPRTMQEVLFLTKIDNELLSEVIYPN